MLKFSPPLLKLPRLGYVVLGSLFAAVGSSIIISSHASSPSVSLEVENGIAVGAGLVSSATASGGRAITFGSAGTGLAVRLSGNRFVDSTNQTIVLRGVNRSGTEYMCSGPGGGPFDGPADATSIDAMKTWHINAVRIPVNEQCWLGINGLPSAGYSAASYRQAIKDYAQLLHSKGMYSVLDLQWAAPGTTKSTGLIAMPDSDHALDFWTSAATAFKSDPAMMLDVFNEPFPDNNQSTNAAWSCWKKGGTCSGISYQAAGMQQLVSTIRATGATNVVLLGGIQYSNNLSQWALNKPADPLDQLAASWHIYNFNACNNVSCWNSQIAPIAANVPVLAGEIGQSGCNHSFIDGVMDWADTKNISYLGWAWNTYDCSSFPSLISNFNGTPTSFGIGLKNRITSLQ